MAEVDVYEGYHFSQTRYKGFPWSMSIIGKVTSKTNKAIWTMKNSQRNMLLFDEIVQPQNIISLEWNIPQNSLSIIFLDSTKLKKYIWRKINIFQATLFNHTIFVFNLTDKHRTSDIYISHNNCLGHTRFFCKKKNLCFFQFS